MNVPQITALIGKNVIKNQKNSLERLVKPLRIKINNDEEPYAVKMIFDISQSEIIFEIFDEAYSDEFSLKYNYFGNNSARSSQIYLTRDIDSFRYLIKGVFNDLFLSLQKHFPTGSGLAQILKQIEKAGLIKIGTKTGEGIIDLNKMAQAKKFAGEGFLEIGDKKIEVKKYENEKVFIVKEFGFEEFVRLCLGYKKGKNRFLLMVPVLKSGESEIVLPQHHDYIKLIEKVKKLDGREITNVNNGRICYICNERNSSVTAKNTTEFDRDGINKIFITKKINFTKSFNIKGYDFVYAICKKCYQHLKNGEKIIKERFTGSIAGEKAFILPEGLFEDFNYDCIEKLKSNCDFAFRCKDASSWIKSVKSEIEWMEQRYYVINYLIYRTDGNSITVIETIEDVPTLRFNYIMEVLSKHSLKLSTRNISMDTIYRIIPVRNSKQKKQLDIGRVLSVYKALLKGIRIDVDSLLNYAIEALDKGLKQLGKDKQDNYLNMNLNNYRNGYEDFFIQRIIMCYLVLMSTCQELNILDRKMFNSQLGEGMSVELPQNNAKTFIEKVQKSVKDTESFLNLQGFSNEARALFYLGALVNRVAIAQYQKEHKTKPILKKISFQGMTVREVLRLYEDVIEKLRQYNKITLFAEYLMNKFHEHYGVLDRPWPLNEQANVFYIMSGYSYMVARKAPDLTQEEEESLKEEITQEVDQI